MNHTVQCNECTSATHAGTAVYQEGRGVEKRMMSPHSLNEMDEAGLVNWYPVIRPDREMIMGHY